MLLYSLLHLTGYDLSLDEIKNFRQWGSKTAGHPEYGHAPGIETTTGPLGQGLTVSVGMAMAERHLAACLNRPGHEVIDHYTYCLVSDGDLMEGISHEAASLAGHLQLGKLICLYDDNHISIEGKTDIAFTENRLQRFAAYEWHTQSVEDGNDLAAIEAAIAAARLETGKPSLIAVRTQIGYGSPNRQGTAKAHGEPLGDEEIKLTRANLGWPAERFHIPEEALTVFRKAVDRGKELEHRWQEKVMAYGDEYPDLADQLQRQLANELPAGWDRDIPTFPADEKGKATRVSSGLVLNSIAQHMPALIGGSADLAPSNMTMINEEKSFQADSREGRNIHFGVREHGMGAIMNGLALHGGLVPYGGTFLIFSDYMRPAIRLAALMKQHVIYVFTHDSIGLGEDGPTHQPIEHLASLRAMPNVNVIRPADANETAEAWKVAIATQGTPTVLALSRQNLPTLDRSVLGPAAGLAKGAYILQDADTAQPDAILLASGSEVPIIMEAAAALKKQGLGIRVVSMPCWELFEAQSEAYRRSVLPPAVTVRVAIEAGATQGWSRYVGDKGTVIGLDHFGASAPAKELYTRFGLTAANVEAAILALRK
jgi:transketolase